MKVNTFDGCANTWITFVTNKQTLRGVGVERCPWLDMEAIVKAHSLNKKIPS